MPIGFMAAVKAWNAHHKMVNTAHVWAVPRKGTSEHAEVKRIMAGEEAHRVVMTEKQRELKEELLSHGRLQMYDASPSNKLKGYDDEDLQEFDFKGLTLLQGVESGNIYIHGAASSYQDKYGKPVDKHGKPIEPSNIFVGRARRGRFGAVELITPLSRFETIMGFRSDKRSPEPAVNAPPTLVRASISAMPSSAMERFEANELKFQNQLSDALSRRPDIMTAFGDILKDTKPVKKRK